MNTDANCNRAKHLSLLPLLLPNNCTLSIANGMKLPANDSSKARATRPRSLSDYTLHTIRVGRVFRAQQTKPRIRANRGMRPVNGLERAVRPFARDLVPVPKPF